MVKTNAHVKFENHPKVIQVPTPGYLSLDLFQGLVYPCAVLSKSIPKRGNKQTDRPIFRHTYIQSFFPIYNINMDKARSFMLNNILHVLQKRTHSVSRRTNISETFPISHRILINLLSIRIIITRQIEYVGGFPDVFTFQCCPSYYAERIRASRR